MSAASIVPWFLRACAVLFALGFAIPMMVSPLAWARRLGWETGGEHVTVYFGRCLGGLLLAVTVAVARAASRGAARPVVLELMAAGFAAMVWVHVLGWARGTQPWLETLEIPGFLFLAGAAVWLRVAI